MKSRSGFVSNSSSSSFVIALSALTPLQVVLIHEHATIAQRLNMDCADDPWQITEGDIYLEGWTVMDNFSMYDYFQVIGVNMNAVRWGE